MTAEEYLRRVGFWLRDLPWGMRRELLAELREHLAELPEETDLSERLGSPEEYAKDLRAAAGLDHRRGPIAFLRARRPRNVIATLLALTAIALAIGFAVWVQSYQPLASIGPGIVPDGAIEARGTTALLAVVHTGRPFRIGVIVQNTGPFTVRVVGSSESRSFPFPTHLMMSGPLKDFGVQGNYIQGPFTQFYPFDLAPGHARDLFLEAVHPHCAAWSDGLDLGEGGFAVRFRFLWRTETTELPLPRGGVVVHIPKTGGCR